MGQQVIVTSAPLGRSRRFSVQKKTPSSEILCRFNCRAWQFSLSLLLIFCWLRTRCKNSFLLKGFLCTPKSRGSIWVSQRKKLWLWGKGSKHNESWWLKSPFENSVSIWNFYISCKNKGFGKHFSDFTKLQKKLPGRWPQQKSGCNSSQFIDQFGSCNLQQDIWTSNHELTFSALWSYLSKN